jgi:hypothetical protein
MGRLFGNSRPVRGLPSNLTSIDLIPFANLEALAEFEAPDMSDFEASADISAMRAARGQT